MNCKITFMGFSQCYGNFRWSATMLWIEKGVISHQLLHYFVSETICKSKLPEECMTLFPNFACKLPSLLLEDLS